jgi:formylglycine-generating enzyme required for sulfatase activity
MVKINKNNQSTCVCRCGSWVSHLYYCKVANQYYNNLDDRNFNLGFRVCRG